ncbi:MAG: 3-deoxy-7-phosphoheptulonate synthase AroG [Gammaproteobacteria bacterium]|nr:3-deoxy-7-phosphoheptulonate synthase AroG [Gammaproteobacteria bacterium]MCW8840618.1 3-deoxy-7-phosphoheptulonate synthase AroG [Gammaproteobacteria bacterium]MCW8959843.1 3-deoxy-7-phosphoheptulonate synthase AroG [Gammaproteobacteria bacterium]MCW8972296.1 3-deoxy-7-phosphoheptulonate synthase AroG [Gammaproteobacteria bacterium]MCW8992734.1 3-deoxy-7-phosphoheptulonate synthase AroG [Gammaproteobacteria bacterium]
MHYKTDDVRISGIQEVSPPADLHAELPIDDIASETVFHHRTTIHQILHGEDDRLVVIVGPCSIHDVDAAREYAKRLKLLIDELEGELCIVMRVYFEKPRTTVGWKGLINDPDMDESFHINKGLRLARSLLLDLNKEGVPAATEYLDLISPQYIADLISWGAIGARTTESQGHRELASGLSCPIGFKNSTDGGFKIAIDAVHAASRPHVFMSLTKNGHSAIFSTTGNDDCHIILRGGREPNYDKKSVQRAAEQLEKSGLRPNLMIDCSHANSNKEYLRQVDVCRDVAGQIQAGEQRIMGVMLESHLVEGRQDVDPDKELTYGQSVTDACINWETTEGLLRELAEAVKVRRKKS